MVDLERNQQPSGGFTLSGTAESRDARWLAEDLAEAGSGVRAVHNDLRVAHG